MKYSLHAKTVVLAIAAAAVLGACKSNESKPDTPPQAEPAAAAQPAQTAAAPAPAASTASAASQDAACKEKPGKASKNSKSKNAKDKNAVCKDPAPASTAESAPAAAPAPAPAAASASGAYNLSKNKPVTDSSKVVAGEGTLVKGLNDWEGEISGIPAANSKFTKLKIGMPMQQVFDLVGQPTDQGAYITAKAFIPFYFGADRTRWEAAYKGQGRLIFATQSGFGTSQYLIWIIHNSNDGGYR